MRSSTRLHSSRLAGWVLVLTTLVTAGCGDDDPDEPSLDDFLPAVPEPTGEAQSTWAGAITQANSDELIPGPASAGMVGDFYIRSAKARFVIQAPARVIGVVPQGGNVVDAVALGDDGEPVTEDHFGELSMVYVLGRTCDHQRIEVVHDGSGGGAAVVRAIGVTANNDFINLRGIGLIPVPLDLDPDIADSVECATTYVLEPDSSTLHVAWTLFNPGEDDINGPLGALSDTGGETDSFSPERGFERLGISALTTLGDPAPVDYAVFQGPGVSYGVVPRHEDLAKPNSAFLIAGVSVMLFKAEALLDITNPDAFELDLLAKDGVTRNLDLIVGADAADVEAQYLAGRGEATATVSGTVAWSEGDEVPARARVGFYLDGNGDGDLDDEDDLVRAYADVDASGAWSATLAPGDYLVRAEVRDQARSEIHELALAASGASDVALTLPSPIRFDYSITDGETGGIIPGKLIAIGRHPAYPDARLFDTYDRVSNVIGITMAGHGTSVDIGDGADPQLVLPAGGTYRVIATRGTQWSVDSLPVAADSTGGELDFTLHHVAPSAGYVASEYHVHQLGSPDSPVSSAARVASAAAAGVEVFATTDHDYVSDLQPVIEAANLARWTRAIPGLEVTPFVYGHFNAWPIVPDLASPNRGAVDWAAGEPGYAKTPGQIFETMRERGAELVQVNHPRAGSGFSFQEFFDRAGIVYDYEGKTIGADLLAAPVPNEWLRLPDEPLWDPSFNALEVWNGNSTADTNLDGVREVQSLDRVMRDWFNFLSFGMPIVPCGNSDTHTLVSDSMGMPLTYVRVGDATYAALSDALEDGSAVDDVLATLTGVSNRDVIVSNAPFLTVSREGETDSAIGATYAATGDISFAITITAPDWAEFDTLEVFANATPESPVDDDTALQPLGCWTSRELAGLPETEPCMTALVDPQSMIVERVVVDAESDAARWEATLTVTIAAADVAAITRAGATGTDAWLVFRVRGNKAIYPIMFHEVMGEANIDALVADDGSVDALLEGIGVPATAFTAPIYVDFDGGGYSAPFAP
jgi:hypothetical protein